MPNDKSKTFVLKRDKICERSVRYSVDIGGGTLFSVYLPNKIGIERCDSVEITVKPLKSEK